MVIIVGLSALNAAAHGGMEMDKDACKFTVGPYAMHFAVYQPQATGGEEFCADIPLTGDTMVTMDVLDDPLRTLPIEVKVIRDTGNESNPESAALVHVPPALYPTGIVPFAYRFDEPGRYVGVVTAGDKGQYVSRFPFRVGAAGSKISGYLPMFWVLLGGVALYFYSAYRLKKKAANASRAAG